MSRHGSKRRFYLPLANFLFAGAFLFQGIASGHQDQDALAPDSSVKAKAGISAGVQAVEENADPDRIRRAFQNDAAVYGGKGAWYQMVEALSKEIGFYTVPTVYITIQELWAKFIETNRELVENGNALILKDGETGGGVSEETIHRLRTMLRQFAFSKELEEHVRRESPALEGWVIDRSSGRHEDSYAQNLAGLFISPSKKDARLALQGIKEIFEQAIETIWIGQNGGHAMKGFSNLLSKEDGFGVLLQPFFHFDASGTAMSNLYNHTSIEAVAGDAQFAVKPQFANAVQYVFEKGDESRAAPLQYNPTFLKYPFACRLKGKDYSAVGNPEEMLRLMERYPKIHGVFSPLSEAQARELNRVVSALESRIGVPLDVEWGYLDGKLYITQIRPIIGDFRKPLVEMDPALKNREPVAQTPISLGHTASVGFTGKMVLFGDGIDDETVKNFEKDHGRSYLRVQSDVATKVLEKPTLAKVLVSPDQGSRQAHNINQLTGRISAGEFVYANGPVLKQGLNKLRFIPHPRIKDVWISKEDVVYFSDGLSGRFYEKKSWGWNQLLDIRQKALNKIHRDLLGQDVDITALLSASDLVLVKEALSNPLCPSEWEDERIAQAKKILKDIEAAKTETPPVAAAPEAEDTAAMPKPPGKFSILFVNDSREALEVFTSFMGSKLSSDGYEGVTAANGWEAADALSSKRFDLVIADVTIPSQVLLFRALGGAKNIMFYTGISGEVVEAKVGKELFSRSEYVPFDRENVFDYFAARAQALREEQLQAYERALERWQLSHAPVAANLPRTEEPKKPGIFRVLMVDDDPTYLQSTYRRLTAALSWDEYKVYVASTVDDVLELLASEEPDMVFFDVGVPHIERLFNKLKAVRHLVIHTGYGETMARAEIGDDLSARCSFMPKLSDLQYGARVKAAREKDIMAYEKAHAVWQARHPIGVRKSEAAQSLTIFIVNNSSAEAKELSDLVAEQTGGDCKVVSVVTPGALERALKKDKPDIVIADMFMDQKDVIDQIIGLATAVNPGVKIIITSEEAAITPAGRFDASRVLGIVEKPFYFNEVLTALRTALSSARLSDAKPLAYTDNEGLVTTAL